jgi:hypothetical protein
MAASETGCMAVPTSKASEHGSELNDRINKQWRGWGRGRAGAKAETRQLGKQALGAGGDSMSFAGRWERSMGATVSNCSRSEHL